MRVEPFAMVLNCIYKADIIHTGHQNKISSVYNLPLSTGPLIYVYLNTHWTDALFNARVFLTASESHTSAKRRMFSI